VSMLKFSMLSYSIGYGNYSTVISHITIRLFSVLTVLFPKFLTLHTKWTVFPTRPVTFDVTVVSKYGPVPGVGKSCKNSVRNFRELPAKAPVKERKKKNRDKNYHQVESGSSLRKTIFINACAEKK
jgi:hypothetical protein